MSATRKRFIYLLEHDHVPHDKVEQGLHAARVYPEPKTWLRFLDQLLLWLGGTALGVAVIFFVAHNWNVIGRFGKFALVEVLLVAAIAGYCRYANHPLISKVALLCSTLCLGALMALFGQTYQTGADPWQLFFNWAVLMLPWALVARSKALWVVWVALINLAIVLYHQVFVGLFRTFASGSLPELWSLFVFNCLALSLWELLARHRLWMRPRWVARLFAVTAGSAITWLMVEAIVDSRVGYDAFIVWGVWIGAIYYHYRLVSFDLFMLAGLCLAAIVVSTTLLADLLLANADADGVLLITIAVLMMGTAAAMWLKQLHQQQTQQETQ